MLHPVRVPPASGSLPPSDVPSGNTLGSITRRSQASALRPVQFPRQPHVRLVITRILRPPHPARPAGRRNPPCREEAPRPGLRHRACRSLPLTHAPCLRPPKNPGASLWELRFGCVFRVVHIGGSRGHLRALRRQVMSSSFPALPHSYRRLCSLVIPAGTLDPAPCGGKEHLSVLRSQNPVCTGFAKHRQPAGQGSSTSILGPARRSLGEGGCRAKLGGQAWFGP